MTSSALATDADTAIDVEKTLSVATTTSIAAAMRIDQLPLGKKSMDTLPIELRRAGASYHVAFIVVDATAARIDEYAEPGFDGNAFFARSNRSSRS